jgi:hypothetical protein
MPMAVYLCKVMGARRCDDQIQRTNINKKSAMKRLVFLFAAAILMACGNDTKKERRKQLTLSPSVRLDSATEAQMLKPAFDDNKLSGLGIFRVGASQDSIVKGLLISRRAKSCGRKCR